jgi:hypothetical protein
MDDDSEEYLKPSIEIVGLNSSTNGRSCVQHSVCGNHLEKGDLVRLIPVVLDIEGRLENAVKCVKIAGGTETCTVGFIPRVSVGSQKVKAHYGKCAQILDVYLTSENSYKRRLWHQNHGMASAVFLDEILSFEQDSFERDEEE